VERVVWSPVSDNILASSSLDKTLKIWDTRTQRSVTSEKTFGSSTGLAWNPSGSIFALSSYCVYL